MGKYIDVEEFICSLDGSECLDTERDYEEIERRLEEFEAADVEEVRHGKWIKIRYRTFICSCCKRSVYLDGLNVTDKNETKLLRELYPYCHCGAKMDGE